MIFKIPIFVHVNKTTKINDIDMNTNNKGTGNLRLNRETLSTLNSMRAAIKALYKKDLGADETIEMMVKAVSNSNPPLWEMFREMERRKERMESTSIARDIMQSYGSRDSIA